MKFLIQSAAAFFVTVSATCMAQMDHSAMNSAVAAKPAGSVANASLADGLVKKVDKTKGTVTLAHGALPNGMPPMTMAYKVKDTAWLETLQVGQKVRFATDPADGGMTVSHIELAK
jgi:Cu/Ag efflux protein CusF